MRRFSSPHQSSQSAVPSSHLPRPNTGRHLEVYQVRYEASAEQEYLVRTLAHDHILRVPKRHAPAEPFPPERGQPPPGGRLLRWSTYAALGVGLGGLGGVLLGVPVVLASGVLFARFTFRVWRWRRHHRAAGIPVVPAAASAERVRLLSALGQGMLAVTLGSLLFALLAWRLL